jgi:hypothetical protein
VKLRFAEPPAGTCMKLVAEETTCPEETVIGVEVVVEV